ncbi:hypothetical protein CFP56_042630, partial [Quercus suber]
ALQQSKEQKDIFVQRITYLKYSHTLYYVILGWKSMTLVFLKRLSIYPKGNENMNGSGHISIYLAIVDTEKYTLGWEIYTEWGFHKFLSLKCFDYLSQGYLVNDCCVFGAELFVHERNAKREVLTMIKDPLNRTMAWKIENFSSLDKVTYCSRIFQVGDVKWY